jgi:uncharacterized membrane protein
LHVPVESLPLTQVLLAALAGIAIASACGLRAFLPLLALALGARFGLVHLDTQAAWMSGTWVIVALALAAVIEMVGDKVPVVDHALDVVGTVTRPAAAALAGWATFGHVHPVLAYAAAAVLGTAALGVHTVKAKTRLGSTVLTLGHLNPLLSLGEDAVAGGISLLAIVAPVVGLVIVLGLLAWLWSRRRGGEPARN